MTREQRVRLERIADIIDRRCGDMIAERVADLTVPDRDAALARLRSVPDIDIARIKREREN